jgi:hypothetical protein
MINAGLPMATPNMAQMANTIGSLPADPNETALQQYIQQLASQGRTGTPEYLMAGGELQHRQNLREEAQAQQAAGVQQQPPVMQQLAQLPQQLGYPQQAPATPNVAQSMKNEMGAVAPVQPGIMQSAQAGGIETLPTENLDNIENYAGGGIVAFDEGGEVPGYFSGGKLKNVFKSLSNIGEAGDPNTDQRIRTLYEEGKTSIPSGFFPSLQSGGFRKVIGQALTSDAQKKLDSMWADKNKADIAAFFSGAGGGSRRLSEEDVEKYGLAGGGVVAFNNGGFSSEFGGDLGFLTPSSAEPFVRAKPAFFPPELIGKVGLGQVKDIEEGRYGSTTEQILQNLGFTPKAFAQTSAKKEDAAPTAAPRPPAPALDTGKKPPASDATEMGLAAIAKDLIKNQEKAPTLASVAQERTDYYKTLGIDGDPYAKILERARKEAGPDKEKADKNRMFWETIGAIGSGIGEASSKQGSKTGQFLEDLNRGLKRGVEKAPEGLREIEKLKKERNRALEEMELAKFNYTKSGADSDLKRLDDKVNKLDNKNLKILELRTNLTVEQAKAAGLRDYRASDQDKDLWVAAQKAASDFYSRDPKALTNPELVLPKIRALATQYYNDSKTRGAGAAPASSIDTSKWGDPKVKTKP